MLVNYQNKRYRPGTAEETEFKLEPRVIAGETIMIKVYENKYDKYKHNRTRKQVRPKTKNGGQV